MYAGQGHSPLLHYTVNGRSVNASCVGDIVIFTCSVLYQTHEWTVQSENFTFQVASSLFGVNSTDEPSPFSLEITSGGNLSSPVTTSLTVTAFAGLDGATVSCSGPNSQRLQYVTVNVFGKFCQSKIGLQVTMLQVGDFSQMHAHTFILYCSCCLL